MPEEFKDDFGYDSPTDFTKVFTILLYFRFSQHGKMRSFAYRRATSPFRSAIAQSR